QRMTFSASRFAGALLVGMVAAVTCRAESFASSASSAGSASVGSLSDSIHDSSHSSTHKVAEGEYRIIEVAGAERPDALRLKMQPVAHAEEDAAVIYLDVPRSALVAHAASAALRFCDRPAPLSALQEDRLLRFAALVKRELDGSGASVALIARSGIDLGRFGLRYSHSGVSLKSSANAPWSVRQLYYACDEQRPRLYDQGLAGFLLGTDDPTVGYISIVLLNGAEAPALE